MFKRILVPTDGSEITRAAVATAHRPGQGARRRDLHDLRQGAVPVRRRRRDAADAAAGVLRRPGAHRGDARRAPSIDACDAAGIACHAQTVEGLQPWEAIVDHAAEQRCDLLVMGSHGRSGLASLFLGSETQDVLKHTTVPVLVVR